MSSDVRKLKRDLDFLRDTILFSPPTNDLSMLYSNLGGRNAAHGPQTGMESSIPLVHLLTDVDENGTSTGVFDKINVLSSNIIVDRVGFTSLNLKYLQKRINDGQSHKITVKAGKTLTLQTGGSFAMADPVTVTDKDLAIVTYYGDTGKYKAIVSSGAIVDPPTDWSTFPAISNVNIANFLLSNVSNLGIVNSAGNPRAQLFGNNSPTNRTTLDLVTDHEFVISEALAVKFSLDFLSNIFTIFDMILSVQETAGSNAIQLIPSNTSNNELRSSKIFDILIAGSAKLRLNTFGDIIMLGVVANFDVNGNFITEVSEIDIIDFITLGARGQIYGDTIGANPTLVIESGSTTTNIRIGNLTLTKFMEMDHIANAFSINNLFFSVIETIGLNAIQFLPSNVINNQMRTTKTLEILRAGVNIFTILATGIDLLGVSSLLNIDDLTFADSGINPTFNGQFRLLGTDILAYSGGQVRNLSNITSGQTTIQSHKFTAPDNWVALSGLSTEIIVEVMIKATEITGGLLEIIVDGLVVQTINPNTETFKLYLPAISLEIRSSHNGSWDVTTSTFVRTLNGAGWVVIDNFWKPDGTKLYISRSLLADHVLREYDVSTPWNISTAVFLREFNNSGSGPPGTEKGVDLVHFRHDGKMLYYGGYYDDGIDTTLHINQHQLTTPWDISTRSLVGRIEIGTNGIAIKPDGTKMFTLDTLLKEYTLTTPWNVTTAVFVKSAAIGGRGLRFRADGLRMYIATGGGSVSQYTLTTAWDIATASASGSEDVSGQCTETNGIFIKPDGAAMYVSGNNGTSLHEYTLGITSSFPGGAGLRAYAMVIRS